MGRAALMVAAVAVALCAAASPTVAGGPLHTAIWDSGSDLGLARTRAAGASVAYVSLSWRSVAPDPRPDGFAPENPSDPAYRWTDVDRRLQRIAEAGLMPLVAIQSAPAWAEGAGSGPPGTVRPDPTELARFARAVALRYSGRYAGLPRVRNWQLWAEQNVYLHLTPQFERGRLVSAAWYRRMLNAFAPAIRSVDRDNVVITGGLAPFRTPLAEQPGPGPLRFMREMLCMSKKLKPTCRAKSQFDVWSHHPYTSGGPNHHASHPDDVSLGDLPEMRRLLNAAVRAGHVQSRHPVRFWVTEFSWDSSPPDPKGVPAREHARWVAEALFRMWQSGISLVSWLMLRDDPFATSFFQSGLYYRGATLERDRPKPALRAFRFPFVALPEGRRVVVWGRTPTSKAGAVVVERTFGRGWRRVRVLRANRHGIFTARLRVRPGGSMRARLLLGRDASLPFGVRKTRDREVFAFGTPPR